MPTTRNRRDKRERRVVDAGRRMAEHQTGDWLSLNLPKGIQLWKPEKEGIYEIDIIPYVVGERASKFLTNYAEVGEQYFERTYFTHWGIGPNRSTIGCAARTFGKSCYVCDALAKAFKSPKAETEQLKRHLPKERQLFLILDHEARKKGIQLWEESYHNFFKYLEKKLSLARPEDQKRWKKFGDPNVGYTLRLEAAEARISRTTYLEFTVDKFVKRSEPLDEKYLEHGICLDDVPTLMKQEAVKKLYLATSEDAGSDDDDRPRGRSRGKDKDEEDEEEGEDEEEEETEEEDEGKEEEEEEEAPKRPAKKKKKKKDTQEEDEDEEGEDEEGEDEEGEDEEGEDEEEEEEEEEEESNGYDFKKGQAVSFIYRGKKLKGKIVKLVAKDEIAHVQVKGHDRPNIVDYDELQVVGKTEKPFKEKDEEDEEEDKPRRRGKKPKDEEDEDEEGGDDDEEEQEEEEEEESSGDDDNEEGDEDEGEDEEEEEEAPRRRRRGKK